VYLSSFQEAQKAGRSESKRMMRIRQEMAALSTSLPPGIFVSFDQRHFDVLRCLIIGAEGTPYANGCFLCDMYLPPDYPQVPPKCNIITTGAGKFRFNANLYANGKVCLSLLGTWAGPGWDPQMSTILQVLLSIQAMIMCEDPIQNEPSWEHKIGTPQGERFDRSMRHGTMLYAMKSHITTPPYGFEDIVKSHFWLNKAQILQQIEEWKRLEAEPCSAAVTCNYGREDVVADETFETTTTSLSALLTDLAQPDIRAESDSDSDDSDDE
jgi:ubiquitin-protein ligase